MGVHPLKRLLNPTHVALASIIENTQCDEIHVRCDTRSNRVIAADDASHVRTVITTWSIVVRVRIVLFSEIPSSDNSVAGTETFAKCNVIPCDSAVNDRNCLPLARQPKLLLHLRPTG